MGLQGVLIVQVYPFVLLATIQLTTFYRMISAKSVQSKDAKLVQIYQLVQNAKRMKITLWKLINVLNAPFEAVLNAQVFLSVRCVAKISITSLRDHHASSARYKTVHCVKV